MRTQTNNPEANADPEQNVYLAIIFYVPAVALPKVAILLFYLRLNPDRKFRYSVFAILALTVGYMVALDLAQIFGCSPVSKFWDLSITSGKCVDVTKIYLANPIINTIVDLLVLFIPIPMVLRLHISQRYKLCLAMLFAVGSSTVIVSAVRIWAIAVSSRSTDTTWHVTISTSLIVVESNLTVACGSVIMLRPFFQRHFPSILARFAPSANQSGPSGQSPGAKALDFERSKNSQYRTKISGGKGSNSRSWPGWSSSTAFRSHEEDEDMENLNAELKQLPASRTHFHDHHRSGAKMGKEYGNEHGGDFGYPGLGGEGRRQNDHLPTKGISDEELSGKSSQEDVIGLARGGPPPDDDDTGQRDPYRLSSKDVESGIMKTVTLDVR